MREAFITAPTRIEVRPAGPCRVLGVEPSDYPSPAGFFPPLLREGVAAERNSNESAVLLALHFPSHQDLHASTVECLPGGFPYP
jgi:hypothetical protein